jgi:hypothetical protein
VSVLRIIEDVEDSLTVDECGSTELLGEAGKTF